MSSLSSKRGSWVAMVVVALLALGVGLFVNEAPARSTEERTTDLAESVKCPTCRSQSVAESEAPIAREIRGEIADRIEAGVNDYLRAEELHTLDPRAQPAGACRMEAHEFRADCELH